MWVTVRAGQTAVVYRDGVLDRVLVPGRYWQTRRRTAVVPVDMRLRLLSVAGQEVFTSDGVTVRATAVVQWRVTDAREFLERAEAPVDVLYTAVQLALREAIGRREFDELLRSQGRAAVNGDLTGPAAKAAESVGAQAREVVLRDVAVVGELRAALAETALERQRGRASLERACGESAALPSLANRAKVLQENPALARLRLVQAAAEAGGTIVVSPRRRTAPDGEWLRQGADEFRV